MDAIYTLSRNIIATTYERLTADVVDVTRKQVMDSLGVALAGSAGAGVSGLVELLQDWGGKKESTLWVYGGKLPCAAAAQANATMIHAMDFDDTHDAAVLHPSAVVVPVAFAMAERQGSVDGKTLITAMALGADLAARLCLATKLSSTELGWHFTALHGCFSAAAVAGKLLQLDEETLVNAFGIVYHQAAGNLLCIDDGVMTKRAGAGFSARNGIVAALMAQKGITGGRNVLEGRRGLYNVYHRGSYDPARLVEGLGEQFEGVNVSFKPYPCCRYNHPAIDALLSIIRQHSVKAGDVDKVTIRVGRSCWDLLCDPPGAKHNPSSIVDSQFSLPWAAAVAIARGKVGMADFSAAAIKDSQLKALAHKVTPVLDGSLSRKSIEASVVELKTTGGQVYTERVDEAYGSPENPMDMEAIAAKLRDCAAFAARPISEDKVERLIKLVSKLETVGDVSRMVRLLQ